MLGGRKRPAASAPEEDKKRQATAPSIDNGLKVGCHYLTPRQLDLMRLVGLPVQSIVTVLIFVSLIGSDPARNLDGIEFFAGSRNFCKGMWEAHLNFKAYELKDNPCIYDILSIGGFVNALHLVRKVPKCVHPLMHVHLMAASCLIFCGWYRQQQQQQQQQ